MKPDPEEAAASSGAAHGRASAPQDLRIVLTISGVVVSTQFDGLDTSPSDPDGGHENREAERLRAEIAALDAHHVPNVHKAISIWLWRNWPGELAGRWGPHSNPHAIRYWRAAARRARPTGGPLQSIQSPGLTSDPSREESRHDHP